MDPLSVAASVAGLMSLTLEVLRRVESFYQAAKEAPNRIRDVQEELSLMHSALQQLSSLLASAEMKTSSFALSSVLTTALTSCGQSIESISAKLQRPKQGSLARVKEALRWPFNEDEILRMLETLRRHTSTFQFSLTIESCKLLSRASDDAAISLQVQLRTARQVLELTKDVGTLAESAREASKVSLQIADILHLVNTFHGATKAIQDISKDVRALALDAQEAKDQQILDWLSPTQYSQRHNDVRARRLPGTGQWLLSCEKFQAWLDSKTPMLWCTGGPGVGKSVLTSLVIDHILDQGLETNKAMAYFYFDYRDQDQQKPMSFVKSILRQVATRTASLPQPLVNFHERFKRDLAACSMTDLLEVFKDVCATTDQVYVVLDALDECRSKDHRKEILRFLSSLDLGITRLFATSRSHPHDIKQHFAGIEPILIQATEADLNTYCYRMIELSERTRELVDGPLKDEIAAKISRNAQGMFLLPVLQMQIILEAMTRAEIRRSLRNLSASLGQAFQDTIQRIDEETPSRRQVAMRCLMWVSRARRPLSVEELRQALATEIGESQFDEDNLLQSKYIIDCCFGLMIIEEESSTVRLVHYTLQDYLQSRHQHRLISDETEITKICLTYLCLGGMNFSFDLNNSDDSNISSSSGRAGVYNASSFLIYASVHWGHHAQQALVSEIFDLAMKFLRNLPKLARAREIQMRNSPQRAGSLRYCTQRITELDGLSMVAGFGLPELISPLLKDTLPTNATDTYGSTPLHEAALYGHLEIVDVLLEWGGALDPLDFYFNTPLYLAVTHAREAVALQLLRRGANPDELCLDYWTALHKAADEGNRCLVQMLLDHGASIHAQSARGLIPLHRAAGRGWLHIMKILVDKGSPIDSISDDEWTPLHGASSSGQHEAVKLLLEHNAAIDFQSADGLTPLHRACRGHSLTVVSLLQHGANHLIRDHGANIPLHRAAEGGHTMTVRMLLDHDPPSKTSQLSAVNTRHRTPREEAVYAGHWETALHLRDETLESLGAYSGSSCNDLELAIEENNVSRVEDLLSKGFDVEESNGEGSTSLHKSDTLTPLHKALLMGHEAIAELLIKEGASIHTKTADGWEALHCAANKGREGLVHLCLSHGANIGARTADGQTALHKVCKSGYVNTTRLLLDKGANVEARDYHGWQPLHVAAAGGFREIVDLLIEEGADVEARVKGGLTTHACAALGGHHALVEYLRLVRLEYD